MTLIDSAWFLGGWAAGLVVGLLIAALIVLKVGLK